MFLQLNHKNLEAYKAARQFLIECYKATSLLPAEEKYNLCQQIRRAALSVKLNIAEGSSRKSEVERKRFYEISRSSLVEIDTAFESARDLSYYEEADLSEINKLINKTFALLTGLIK
jgi:four helix bundle protein